MIYLKQRIVRELAGNSGLFLQQRFITAQIM